MTSYLVTICGDNGHRRDERCPDVTVTQTGGWKCNEVGSMKIRGTE